MLLMVTVRTSSGVSFSMNLKSHRPIFWGTTEEVANKFPFGFYVNLLKTLCTDLAGVVTVRTVTFKALAASGCVHVCVLIS